MSACEAGNIGNAGYAEKEGFVSDKGNCKEIQYHSIQELAIKYWVLSGTLRLLLKASPCI